MFFSYGTKAKYNIIMKKKLVFVPPSRKLAKQSQKTDISDKHTIRILKQTQIDKK